MIDYFISNGETTTITLSGRLLSDNDLKAVSEAIDKLDNWKIVIDLKDLTYINSSGIAFLVRILTRSRIHNGDTVIIHVNASLNTLFTITKMHEVFTIYPSKEEAINHFKQG